MPLVLDADHRVAPVECGERVPREREPAARRQAAAAALARGHGGAPADLLQVTGRGAGVDRAALELAVVIVDAHPRAIEAALGAAVVGRRVQVERGAEEVEVREQRGAGREAPATAREAPHVGVSKLGHAPGGVAEGQLGRAGDGRAEGGCPSQKTTTSRSWSAGCSNQ